MSTCPVCGQHLADPLGMGGTGPAPQLNPTQYVVVQSPAGWIAFRRFALCLVCQALQIVETCPGSERGGLAVAEARPEPFTGDGAPTTTGTSWPPDYYVGDPPPTVSTHPGGADSGPCPFRPGRPR
jgi:hypothetical protein